MFVYFNPPNVVDVTPLIGPIKGGTIVNLWGTDFEKKNITCTFGKTETKGVFLNKNHIQCIAP